MSLTPDIAAEVLAACQAGADEASAALSRALDNSLAMLPGEPSTAAAAKFAGPGLAIVLKLGAAAAVFVVPESTALLPKWYATPDATGTSKLATLAQELGMLLLPEDCMPDDFVALHVKDLAAALARGGMTATAPALPLTLTAKAATGIAWLVWPLTAASAIADPPAAPVAAAAPTPPPAPARRPTLAVHAAEFEEALPAMPNYTRSLLKIRVPIVVTLAKSHQPLSRIIELAPGSIIPFAKSCDDTLTLEVNNREVAVGEAVKVGDKFGLRITSMTLPPERFVPLKSKK